MLYATNTLFYYAFISMEHLYISLIFV